MKMDYAFEVQRGWPNGCALESNETITDAATLNAGDVVEMQADGTINVCGARATTLAHVGWVVRGNGDSDSVAASGDQAVVLWGNFIARTQAVDITGLSPGDPLQAGAGILEAVGTGAITGPAVAEVIAVHAADADNPASATILVR